MGSVHVLWSNFKIEIHNWGTTSTRLKLKKLNNQDIRKREMSIFSSPIEITGITYFCENLLKKKYSSNNTHGIG